MAEAFVLETLRTARTKASPRGGRYGVAAVSRAAVSRAAGLGVALLVERVSS